jgi:hypothetical protein
MTETIKVEVDDELARQFRKKALERYGYKKGAMKKALVEAMRAFPPKAERKTATTDWTELEGIVKTDRDSVWLQHHAWDNVD